MPGRQTGGSRRAAARGLTLVEALAALVIVGGCVTAMLVAQGGSIRQMHDGVLALTAREVAEELIASWRLAGVDLAVGMSGVCEGLDGWTWRHSTRKAEVVDGLTVRHLILDLRYAPDAGRAWSRRFEWVVLDD